MRSFFGGGDPHTGELPKLLAVTLKELKAIYEIRKLGLLCPQKHWLGLVLHFGSIHLSWAELQYPTQSMDKNGAISVLKKKNLIPYNSLKQMLI